MEIMEYLKAMGLRNSLRITVNFYPLQFWVPSSEWWIKTNNPDGSLEIQSHDASYRTIWTDTSLDDIWPMALDYAAHLHNKFTIYEFMNTKSGQEGFITMTIFYGANDPWKDECIHPLNCSTVWGCPTFVLYPVIQDDGNITK